MYLVSDMMPSKNTQRKIMTLLAEFNFTMVREKSAAAAKFYIWVGFMFKVSILMSISLNSYIVMPRGMNSQKTYIKYLI